MKMKTRKNICLSLLVGLCVTFVNNSFEQEISTLYFMNNLPQANGINPAIINDSSKIVIAIPILPGIEFGLNSTFCLSDFLTPFLRMCPQVCTPFPCSNGYMIHPY